MIMRFLADNNWYIFIKSAKMYFNSAMFDQCVIESKQVRVFIKVTCLYLLDKCWISCNINGTRYFTGNRIVAAIFSCFAQMTEKMHFQMFSWFFGYVNTKGKTETSFVYFECSHTGKNYGTILGKNLYFFPKKSKWEHLGENTFFLSKFSPVQRYGN